MTWTLILVFTAGVTQISGYPSKKACKAAGAAIPSSETPYSSHWDDSGSFTPYGSIQVARIKDASVYCVQEPVDTEENILLPHPIIFRFEGHYPAEPKETK